MRVILIDDEKGPLGLFTEYIADKNVNCSFFTEQAQDCLTAIKAEKFDAVFLDIRMPMPNFSDGVALAQKIIEIDKNIKIFFITAYSFNEVDIKNKIGKNLIKICQKPFSKADVDEWINLLQKSLRYERRILIKTFGEFSLHVDNELIKFDSLKSQELLAYLVHYNGNYAYRDRTATYLWQNQEDSKKIFSSLKNERFNLKQLLNRYELDDLVCFERGRMRMNMLPNIECDSWKLLKHGVIFDAEIHGEYMRNYEWGSEGFSFYPLVKK